ALLGICIYVAQHYVWPKNHLPKNAVAAEYDRILANNEEVLFIVVVKKGDDIFVLNEGTKQLVFEFNLDKPADVSAYQIYNDLLVEAKSLAEKQK
ncbi:MAG: hypothetical protein AAB620_00395, partial [Patescibacteria group bacterium]